ncbi:MAG: RNA-directed DNA polymerase [Candidatus Magasanikbacteria bacterium]|nr:RNA-directed DNA polymerase [Candidatus Magasanikbacteria bacterium]
MTSQLFVNVYLDGLDHWVKEALCERYYMRYTDDMIIVHSNPVYLRALIAPIAARLTKERRLMLHPVKMRIRKLSHGIDFLGYVALPHYRVLRTKTKRRMLKRVNALNVASYLGLLQHCAGFTLSREIRRRIFFL